jgi:nicotinamidase-related amidase
MDVLLVVDMQTALLEGPPKHDLDGVIDRINRLAAKVRSQAGKIIFVQHVDDGGNVGPLPPACQLLPDLEREPSDIVVHKHLNDAFAGSNLKARLDDIAPDRLLIAGWATDFCVDSTVRSAVSHGYDVVVVADAHTLNDRPHLDAPSVIRHHNWIWNDLIAVQSIQVVETRRLLSERGPDESSA